MSTFPNPPAKLPGDDLSISNVDATMFDTDGTVRFDFSYKNNNIGYRLKIRLRKWCQDHNFFWVPWKDCRPHVDLVILESHPYQHASVPIAEWFVFDASID